MSSTEQGALTPAMFVLLLALHNGPRHGYALMADVARLTEQLVTLGPATLYRSLQRMRVAGLIEELPLEQATDPDQTGGDRRAQRRRRYRITAAGRRAARTEAQRLAVLTRSARQTGLLSESSEESAT